MILAEKSGQISLEEIRKHLHALVEQSSDVFWVRNADYTKQIYISPAYEKVWGRSCGSLYEHPDRWAETLVPEDYERLQLEVKKRKGDILPGDSFSQSYRIRIPSDFQAKQLLGKIDFSIQRPDQSIRWIEDQCFAIFGEDGNHIGFAGIARDITNKKQREAFLLEAKQKAEEVNQAKTTFVQNVRHDMRTPLGGIIGMAEIMAGQLKDLEGPYAEYAQMIHAAGQQLMGFLDDVLGLLQQEAVDFKGKEEPFSMVAVAEQVVAMFKPALQQKQLDFDLSIDDKLPERAVGNHEGLHRILMNLMSNAVKFTEAGKIQLSLSKGQYSSDREIVLKIQLADTGIGIPADKKDAIFEKLTRLSPAYQGKYQGTGLGLYMVKQFVQVMDGEIYLKSEEGKGSEFTVALPFKLPLLMADEV